MSRVCGTRPRPRCGALVRREAGEVFAVEDDAAARELRQAHHGAQRRRLAHAVAADDGQLLLRRDR